ncbi:hypothetical protein B7435_26010 [Mycolicibacterium peregrinum]|uniref:hypothetical protein n=1 Tax=Mycolicibacterium peregrinum TaxID=43304 RepID=UPI000B4BE408|nr:hypothetical protein [Mycolicibacterium peregrinum]OWL98129.1 hypothetical protein B7435_26010 [Mycolicibacterium peregrinum]
MADLPITDDQLSAGRAAVADAALTAAQEAATRHLISGLSGLSLNADAAPTITTALNTRDFATHAWLAPYEVPWSLLIIRLLAGASPNLATVVGEARNRGATVPQIAAAIGTSTQNVYTTYADQVVRKKRAK